jgi:pyridoxal phosphate enzyme (YggS family)
VERVAENVEKVRERIAAAALRAGRRPEEITLVAATKGRTVEEILAAREAGIADFGENYWQEARPKVEAIRSGIRWHFFGHLQRNKAKHVARHFDVLQSLDSLTLAASLSKTLQAVDRKLQVLVEVNIDDEPTKSGVEPEAAVSLAAEASKAARVEVSGLMTMGAAGVDEPELRRRFRRMRALFDRLPAEQRAVLSMGMTSDFEVAIEEGATMVRIGTAIFGPRPVNERRGTHGRVNGEG